MRGLFIGRFQPLHNGHISIMEAAMKDVDELVVVIGSAESSHTLKDPFTAGERMEMLLGTCMELGWGERVTVVPVRDVNRYSIWADHVLSYIPGIDVVYSNNALTAMLFREKGFEVRSTPLVDRNVLSGVRIRRMMVEGEDWEVLVPPVVVRIITELDGVRRMKELSERGDRS
ncbi:MAG TPA: nicotinamide-nucleotide adenylyltransferase [Euryarchaeota archaeon]|nr:nicotinamide-nucleotide adenylyltransferase [Euryarchaeota archaeon]